MNDSQKVNTAETPETSYSEDLANGANPVPMLEKLNQLKLQNQSFTLNPPLPLMKLRRISQVSLPLF